MAPQEKSERFARVISLSLSFSLLCGIITVGNRRGCLLAVVPCCSSSRPTHISCLTVPGHSTGFCAPEAVPRMPPFAFLCNGGRTGDLLSCPPGAAGFLVLLMLSCTWYMLASTLPDVDILLGYLPHILPYCRAFRVYPPTM